jgi:hypothetical protein
MDQEEMSNLCRGPSIDKQTWAPQAILVSDWLISKISSVKRKITLV